MVLIITMLIIVVTYNIYNNTKKMVLKDDNIKIT